jgi:hypothetical protein
MDHDITSELGSSVFSSPATVFGVRIVYAEGKMKAAIGVKRFDRIDALRNLEVSFT